MKQVTDLTSESSTSRQAPDIPGNQGGFIYSALQKSIVYPHAATSEKAKRKKFYARTTRLLDISRYNEKIGVEGLG